MTAASLVSVIIPAHNVSRWIGETLDSVLVQTHRPLEILVADNGSTDDTRAVIARFGKVVRLIDAPVRGCGAARNAALEHATGEFVQFLDGDDLLEPWKIERQLALLHETRGDVAWGSFWEYAEPHPGAGFQRTVHRVPAIVSDPASEMLRAQGWIQIGALLLRRTAPISGLRFAPNHRVEDVHYLLRALFGGAAFVRGEGDSGLLFRRHTSPRSYSTEDDQLPLASLENAKLALAHWLATDALTPTRRDDIVDVFIYATRAMSQIAPDRVAGLVAELRALDPSFVRRLPSRLRIPSRVLGYERAETLARRVRQLKKLTHRALRLEKE